MRKISLLVSASLFLFVLHVQAQGKTKYNFGKVSVADFNVKPPATDSSANAVIIQEIGSTDFDGDNNGDFIIHFTRFMRVKILNKNGFDIGDFAVQLYHQKDEYERLYSVKGSTFNLVNGTITETKLDEKSIYTTKYNEEINIKKFSMPGLKEGAVFDLEYTVVTPFDGRLPPWEFQSEYPCLWSEYVVTIPPPFHYMMNLRGDRQFEVNTTKPVFGAYTLKRQSATAETEMFRITGSSIEQRWVKKNVPALHPEPFMTVLKNYFSQVSFQLKYFQWETSDYTGSKVEYMPTWSATAHSLLENPRFGLELDRLNTWMNEAYKNLAVDNLPEENKIRIIFKYVRDNFTRVSKEGYDPKTIWVISSLEDAFRKKSGNVAEINLILVAMLRRAGIHADPVILSTRDYGMANPNYPLIAEYNYLIAAAVHDNKIIPLDASQSYNGFGDVPVECYNGDAHVVNEKKPLTLDFSEDSISEIKISSVFITNDEKGRPSATVKTTFGKSGSFDGRREIVSSSKKMFEQKIKTALGSSVSMENFGLDSLTNYDVPLGMHYDLGLNSFTGEMVYFNPLLGEEYGTNPFRSAVRRFPVEIPFKIDNSYFLNMEIPTGYEVEELPKSAKVAYNGNEGFFEYLIQKNETNIQMRVRLKFNKAFFPKEEYSNIRDFYAFIVKKANEQIVFKKIK